MKFNTKLFILIFSGGLSGCAMFFPEPPPPQQPISALELAVTGLPDAKPALSSSPADGAETSSMAAQRMPIEIQQQGSIPPIDRVTPPTPQLSPLPSGEPDVVNLDFEQIELRQLLDLLAEELGLNLVIDPSIADKVTMRSAENKPLKRSDLWPLFQLLLSEAGITMEKKGGVYHLRKLPSLMPAEIGGKTSGLEHSTAAEVMQITPLRYVTIDAAINIIRPLVEPQGRVIHVPTLNLIGIVTSPDRLQRVNKILDLIDADPFVHRGMRLYRLYNGKSSEVQSDLDKILKAVEGNQPAYQVIDLERINSILVVAPPNRGFEQVSRWITILDEQSEVGNEQVFIYRVRNLKADALAGTLSEVFQLSENQKDAIKPPSEVAETPQPSAMQGMAPSPFPPPLAAAPVRPSIPQARGEEGAISAHLQATIVADEDTNSLLVRARPRDYQQLLETIKLLDQVPKEVMINVVVAEVTLTEETRFGIDWGYWFGDRGFIGTNFGLQGDGRTRPTSEPANEFNFGNLSGLVINQVGNSITSLINLMASNNDVQVLMRPSLLVRNNQEATINVGSDQPTITAINTQAGNTGVINNNYISTNEVQYRQTGITLKVKPQINEDGIINLEVSQEVSQVSEKSGIEKLPAFDQRKIETSVLVRSGSSIVLGGLIETHATNSKSGVPGLKDTPIVSPLFSAQGQETKRTELVVIIIPQIVNPEADNQAFVERFISERMKLVATLLNEHFLPLSTPAELLPSQPQSLKTP